MQTTTFDNTLLIDEYLPNNIHVYLYSGDWRHIQETTLGNFYDNFIDIANLLKHPDFITKPSPSKPLIKCYKRFGDDYMVGYISLLSDQFRNEGVLVNICFVNVSSFISEAILWMK